MGSQPSPLQHVFVDAERAHRRRAAVSGVGAMKPSVTLTWDFETPSAISARKALPGRLSRFLSCLRCLVAQELRARVQTHEYDGRQAQLGFATPEGRRGRRTWHRSRA